MTLIFLSFSLSAQRSRSEGILSGGRASTLASRVGPLQSSSSSSTGVVKKKTYVMVTTLSDGRQITKKISRDDPILAKVCAEIGNIRLFITV